MEIFDRETKLIKLDNELFNKIYKKSIPIIDSFKDFYRDLNKNEYKYLENYKNNSYNIFNFLVDSNIILDYNNILNLKNGKSLNLILKEYYNDLKKEIQVIDNLFLKKSIKIKNNYSVFRGEHDINIINNILNLKIGETINYKSFLSTSIDFKSALRFTKFSNENKIILLINIKKNNNIIYLPWLDDLKDRNIKKEKLYFNSEFEILLNRNANLRLKKIKKIEDSKKKINNLDWYTDINSKKKFINLYIFDLVDYNKAIINNFNDIKIVIDNKNLLKNLYYFDIKNNN